MGSACCIAAREKDLPSRTGGNALYRNVRCSPTWSFQWENRRRVASEIDDSPYQTSHRFSRDVSVEVKGPVGSDRGKTPSRLELFLESRKRKQGKEIDPISQEAIEKFQQLKKQREEGQISLDDDAMFADVLGPEKNGYVRAYGPGKKCHGIFWC